LGSNFSTTAGVLVSARDNSVVTGAPFAPNRSRAFVASLAVWLA
jgi:hypothetical protein